MRSREWFVGFVLRGDATLRELARCYPLANPPEDVETVADLFAARFAGRPRIGDGLALGKVLLTVLALEASLVTQVGLLLLG